MTTKGTLDFKALTQWMEDIAAAGESVDDAVAEILVDAQPFVTGEIERNLHKTSEQWTPLLALTIAVSGVQQTGNYIFIEASAGAGDYQAASAKEYGTARQAAEPFFRPTFRGHLLKNRLKSGMKLIAERYGLK